MSSRPLLSPAPTGEALARGGLVLILDRSGLFRDARAALQLARAVTALWDAEETPPGAAEVAYLFEALTRDPQGMSAPAIRVEREYGLTPSGRHLLLYTLRDPLARPGSDAADRYPVRSGA